MPTVSQRPRRHPHLYYESNLQIFVYQLLHYRRDKGILQLLDYRRLLALLLSIFLYKLYDSIDILKRVRRLYKGRAVFKYPDETARWLTHYLTNGPPSQCLPRDVEVTVVPFFKLKASAVKMASSITSQEKTTTPDNLEGKGGDKATPEVQKEDIPMLYKAAHNADTKFVFEGTYFWATRERQVSKDGRAHESISLTYWSRSTAPLDRLILEARRLYMAENQKMAVKKVPMYRMDRRGHWQGPTYGDKRRLDTLYLPNDLKQAITSDVRTFFSAKEQKKYAARSIAYRRGYLFYGPPGTGKSTLAHVLASEYCDSLYVLDLGSANIDDDKFLQAMSLLPPRCLLLIEDIDVAFVKRDDSSVSPESGPHDSEEVKPIVTTSTSTNKSSISLSCLLNSVDGAFAPEGRLLVMTTNCIDALDEALLRPGRCDRKYHIKNASSEQANALFCRWYTSSGQPSDQTRMQAEAFAKAMPSEAFSVATLQSYLLAQGDHPQEAVDNIGAWVKEELKRKQKNA